MPLNKYKSVLNILPRRWKRVAFVLIDTLFCFVTAWLAFSIRIDEFASISKPLLWVGCSSVLLAVPILVRMGFYRAIFRFSGWHAALALAKALCIYMFLFVMLFTIVGISNVPRSVGVVQPVFLLVAIGASRLLVRLLFDIVLLKPKRIINSRSVLIYGGGAAGRQLATALMQGSEIKVIGFLDDDRYLWGGHINGLSVYSPCALSNILKSNPSVTDILLAIPSLEGYQQKAILKKLIEFPVHVRMLPSFYDWSNRLIRIDEVREVEIEEVLGRDPVEPNLDLMRDSLDGKAVLVTGAGGSIGSELCRQIADQNPSILVLVDLSEYALYAIEFELLERFPKIKIVAVLGSVLDQSLMFRTMSLYRINTLYHAAAYKHVPMIEKNPVVGVWNNVFGTLRAVESAVKAKVENFVLVSTDKAVRPANIMGCSKRISELILQAKSKQQGMNQTKLAIVRFGNVLGSSGSVIPIFREQIKKGGPLTVTDSEVVRYFMTIPEASQLVIQAGSMSLGGDVFILDMGEPIKILELAKRMIHLSGCSIKDEINPDGDIEIFISGLRPGEKLYEELVIGGSTSETTHPRIKRLDEGALSWKEIEPLLVRLEVLINENNALELARHLKRIVPEFNQNPCANYN